MIINNKILSIPPHISTSWANIASIYTENSDLVIMLNAGRMICIKDLNTDAIQAIFAAHAEYLEKKDAPQTTEVFAKKTQRPIGEMELPFRMGFNSLDSFGTALQHNPENASAPDLPPEILEKIGSIAKIVTPDSDTEFPKSEPHCNCMYCQIARAIQKSVQGDDYEEEICEAEESNENVSEADLQFCQWEIQQTGDKLFKVKNRLDLLEEYQVHLGNPVGCTCGQTGCEHILAVLKS